MEMTKQVATLPRRKLLEEVVSNRAFAVLVRDLAHAVQFVNGFAPEHLSIVTQDPWSIAKQVRNAGAIFLGRYSSGALGDYCAGPNHVLPTSRTARFSSPLGVYDFQKRSSVIAVSRKGARKLGRIAATLAEGEGLQAHARSAELRLQEKSKAGR